MNGNNKERDAMKKNKNPIRRVLLRRVTYTCVVECGHILSMTRRQFRSAKSIRCYKCGESSSKNR